MNNCTHCINSHISILLATYNGSRFLREQIDSIIEQSHQNWILFIRDDGSNDNGMTEKIINEYFIHHKKIIIFVDKSSVNLGINKNFEWLLSFALKFNNSSKGYYAFADQDDIWEKTKLEDSLKKIQEVERAEGESIPILVHSDLTLIDQSEKIIHPSFYTYQKAGPPNHQDYANLINTLLFHNFVTGCTTLFNHSLAKLIIPFPAEISIHDWWIAQIAALTGKLIYLPYSTINYRQHIDNQIGALSIKNAIFKKDWIFLWKRGQKNLKTSFYHASELKKRFASEKHSHILDCYLHLLEVNPLKRIFLCYKYGFFCKSKIRQLLFFIRLFFL
ncbi:MAG: glycosyltransferase family 2 protein [Oligoflexia bacterium]|nr:glycosyltransferase family 2 protein [Oligoflexia bacterium]